MNLNNFENKKLNINSKEKRMDEYRKQIVGMSYEKALAELDSILNELQMDNVSVSDLQEYYIKGNLIAEYCKNLLAITEQEIIEINSDDIDQQVS